MSSFFLSFLESPFSEISEALKLFSVPVMSCSSCCKLMGVGLSLLQVALVPFLVSVSRINCLPILELKLPKSTSCSVRATIAGEFAGKVGFSRSSLVISSFSFA